MEVEYNIRYSYLGKNNNQLTPGLVKEVKENQW